MVRAEVSTTVKRPIEEDFGVMSEASKNPRSDVEVVADCRGRYCVMAPRGITLLRRRGYRARRFEDGVTEWRLAGQPVAMGPDPGVLH